MVHGASLEPVSLSNRTMIQSTAPTSARSNSQEKIWGKKQSGEDLEKKKSAEDPKKKQTGEDLEKKKSGEDPKKKQTGEHPKKMQSVEQPKK